MAMIFPNSALSSSPQRPAPLVCALALLLGTLSVQGLPWLWPQLCDVALLLVAVGLARWGGSRAQLAAWVLLGLAWAAWHGSQAMAARLPALWEGKDRLFEGQLIGLPKTRLDASSFELQGRTPQGWQARVRVSWYRAPALHACQRWRLRLRLRRPRGLMNPGPLDVERSALSHRLAAVAYVRTGRDNRLLGQPPCIDGLRERIAQSIAHRVPDPSGALLRALAVGDTRGLGAAEWSIARANGISHMLAISGFHVGIAAVVASGLARLLYWLWPRLVLTYSRPQAMAWCGLAGALIYSALAGFGIATVRSLLMVLVWAWQRLTCREGNASQALGLALIALLLADPLAVLAAGFWMSFGGVALLLYAVPPPDLGPRAKWRAAGLGQALLSVCLLPMSLWFFGAASLLGAGSNLVAMPWVSLVILPLLLAALPWLGLWPALGGILLQWAGYASDGLWWWLGLWAHGPGAHWYAPTPSLLRLLLASLGLLWLFLPRGLPLRWLGLCLLLPLLLPPDRLPARGGFEAWVLDVGQGLAVILRTRQHVLVYDMGPRYPSGYDLGATVVLPALHGLGWRAPQRLMISHGDNDHAGGALALKTAYPDAIAYAGEPTRMHFASQPCWQGQSWVWDAVRFEVLWPDRGAAVSGNARSCVLRVQNAGGQLILTGDIPMQVELRLLSRLRASPAAVLVVPHHGSRTASSPALLERLQPRLALVSSGWRNRFHHPHPAVAARYRAAGIPLWNTASEGALQMVFPAVGPPRLARRWRHVARRYWRE